MPFGVRPIFKLQRGRAQLSAEMCVGVLEHLGLFGASTGPRSIERGDARAFQQVFGQLTGLQRGRAQLSAEINGVVLGNSFIYELQRGRAQLSAEIGVSAKDRSGAGGFNGAALN